MANGNNTIHCKRCGTRLIDSLYTFCDKCEEILLSEKIKCACGCGKIINKWYVRIRNGSRGGLRERRFEYEHGGHKVKYVQYDNIIEYIKSHACPVCHRKFYDARTLRVHIDEDRCLNAEGMEKFKTVWDRTCHCGCGVKVLPGRLGLSSHLEDKPWNKGMTKEDDERLMQASKRRLKEMNDELKGVAGKSITSIEWPVRAILDKLRVKYIHQYNFKNLFLCDFGIPSIKLLIECDGDYWHNYPKGLPKDKIRTRQTEQAGWKMLRLWECEIKNDIGLCERKIMGCL